MAAEAQAEGPTPPPPPPPPPPPQPAAEAPSAPQGDKRAPPDDGAEERPEPKRRRACVAALDSVPRAAVEECSGDGDCDGDSFSFYALSFSGVETTPKFGSFNPAAAELVAFDLKRPPPPPAEEVEVRGDGEDEGEGKDGNSH